jgi:hypothetical protein
MALRTSSAQPDLRAVSKEFAGFHFGVDRMDGDKASAQDVFRHENALFS